MTTQTLSSQRQPSAPGTWLSPLFAVILLLGAGFNAKAAEMHDSLTLNGVGSHWLLSREYYVGALYLPTPTSDPLTILQLDSPKRMELRVTAEKWSPRRFAQMWNQAISINNDMAKLNDLADSIIEFSILLKDDLVYGDRIQIDYTPGAGTTITINGTQLMRVKHNEFFNVLLQAWIGPRPPSSDFKRTILGQGDPAHTEDEITRYRVIKPVPNRMAAIKRWVPAKKNGKKAVGNKQAKTQTARTAPAPKPVVATPKTVVAKAPTPKPVKPQQKQPKPVKPKPAAPQNVATTPKPNSKPAPATTQPAPAKPVIAKASPSTPAPKAKPATKAPTEPVRAAELSDEEQQAKAEKAKLDGLKNLYRANMLRLTYRHVIYPSRALDRDEEGDVVLQVTIDRNGEVDDIKYEKESGHRLLDRAAEKAVAAADPYPTIPRQLPGDAFTFRIPIKFRIPR